MRGFFVGGEFVDQLKDGGDICKENKLLRGFFTSQRSGTCTLLRCMADCGLRRHAALLLHKNW